MLFKKLFLFNLLFLVFSSMLSTAFCQEGISNISSTSLVSNPTAAPTTGPTTSATSNTTPVGAASVTNGVAPATTVTNITSAHCDSIQAPVPGSEIKAAHHSYSSVHVDGPYIAMTFDDGPSATLTPRLLDILKERGIKATFFVIGQNAQNHPEILAREAAEGHEIGDHSWSHPQLTKISDARLHEEVGNTADVIFKATGKKPLYLRPPYGAMNARVSHVIEDEYGMKIIFWSVDPLDWKRPGSAVVSQRILAGAKPGAIILSHDIHPGTIEAMPATLDALLAKGYHFVTVSELIAMESKIPAPPVSPAAEPKKKNGKKKNP